MLNHYCNREELEELAVRVIDLSHLLAGPIVQRGEVARDVVATVAAEVADRIGSVLEGVPDGEADPIENLLVDREVLTCTCFGVLHALRSHADGRKTVFEELPWQTLIDMYVPLTELARIPEEEDQALIRRRMRERAYFEVRADAPADSLTPAGPIWMSAEQLADYLQELNRISSLALSQYGPYRQGLARMLCQRLRELTDGLVAYLVLYGRHSGAITVFNARQVERAEVERWTEDVRRAIREGDETVMYEVAEAVCACLEA